MASKRWDISIELVKAIAAILVMNSHMDAMYGNYAWMATGGAIGDALFFFCSGYALFLSNRQENFFNWYKRRLQRICPSVLVISLLTGTYIVAASYYAIHANLGSNWFISCILLYYIILWPVKRYAAKYIWWILLGALCVPILSYFTFGLSDRSAGNIYGPTYLKWSIFFLYMLFGAICGRIRVRDVNSPKPSLLLNALGFVVSAIVFYAIYIPTQSVPSREPWQLFTIIPLFGICWFLWRTCCSDSCARCMEVRCLGNSVRFVGGLCLEILLVQTLVFTTKLNGIFPLNVPVIMVAVIVCAYVVRCLGRALLQTFQSEDYDWREMIKPF